MCNSIEWYNVVAIIVLILWLFWASNGKDGAFAYVITKIDATDLMLSVMSTAALGIGAYAGGYVCGKRQRRNGLLSGVLCGVFIFLIIVILSALFSKATESFSVSAKLVLTLVCAGVGGVVGVNSKSSRF